MCIRDRLIISQYSGKKNIILENILLKLNLKNQNLEYLFEVCTTNKLYWAFIYLKMLSSSEADFLKPLLALHAELKTREANKKTNFLLEELDVKKKSCEEGSGFIGYTMLWYIDLCFSNEKFPKRVVEDDSIKIDPNWDKIICYIINWLLVEQDKFSNLKDLANVDLTCLLKVLLRLFVEPQLRRVIVNPPKDFASEFVPKSYIELIAKLEKTVIALDAEKKKEHQYLNAFYKFFAQAGAQEGIIVSGELVTDAVKALSEVTHEKKDEAVNKKEYEEIMLKLLQNVKLGDGQLAKLTSAFTSSAYNEVLIYLREAKKDYIKCFETYLLSRDPAIKIRIFSWLNAVHKKLKEDDIGYKELKAIIHEKFEFLLKVDIKKTTELIDVWFQHQHEEVIQKLSKEPKLQLNYVQRVLNDKDAEIQKVMKDQETNSLDTDEYKRYYRLLELNLGLLCNLEPDLVEQEIKKKKCTSSSTFFRPFAILKRTCCQ
eukprot:TRINITY_DN3270_c0_g1_i3.p1 TRINITY_DN3270_c0_g1~~TRINITY_DN3270_c0_g1_i3.p1  ORF type:complete len:486 (-),score=108.90 TRINITY_DN3270_c0_g1_i3:899-2356(-)